MVELVRMKVKMCLPIFLNSFTVNLYMFDFIKEKTSVFHLIIQTITVFAHV